MEIEVRAFDGDPREFWTAGELAFSERPREDEFDRWAAAFEADRAIAAYDGPRIVGTAGIFSLELTVPGGIVPAAGVTIVGVHPTHRRQGILRRMMRLQLDAVRARGEPLAILWASEGGIYQRFGYGLGSLHVSIDVERERTAFRRPHTPAGSMRFVDVDEARRRFPPVYDAIRTDRPGFFARSALYWDTDFFPDPEHSRHGASPAFHVVHEVAGETDGYARYRVREDWELSGSKSKLVVVEVMGTNPSAELDVWRFLFDIDLMARIEAWNRPVDDPLLLTVAEPRRLRATVGDALWTRLVDLGAALAARRYASDGRLTLEVADGFCGWNDGTWALSVEAGVPIVERATGAADLACDITDLGAAYLGAFGFRQLADAGRVRELQPAAIARADAMFATERPPWCPRVF